MEYDYLIFGSDISALTLTYYLNKYNKKCLLFYDETIINDNNKIYNDGQYNLFNLIKENNLDLDDIFFNYDLKIIIKLISYGEMLSIILEFITLFFSDKYSKNITLLDFMKEKKFSKKTIDNINELCKYVDGYDCNNYTLYKFLELINHYYLYNCFIKKENLNDILLNKIKEKQIVINVKNNKSLLNKFKSKNYIIFENDIIKTNNDEFKYNNLFKNDEYKVINSIKILHKLEPNIVKYIKYKEHDDLINIIKFYFLLKFISIIFN